MKDQNDTNRHIIKQDEIFKSINLMTNSHSLNLTSYIRGGDTSNKEPLKIKNQMHQIISLKKNIRFLSDSWEKNKHSKSVPEWLVQYV